MIKKVIKKLYRLAPDRLKLAYFYTVSGGRPWSGGYITYKFRYIGKVLRDSAILKNFTEAAPLPAKYGYSIDERVVEYPWALTRIPAGPGKLLDAGSALNYREVLDFPSLREKKITIVNLNKEENDFGNRGINYVYADMRALPFKDCEFDAVTCISTLEHVGLDNVAYTGNAVHHEAKTGDFEKALLEMKRVLKPGGKLLLTVPFGKYKNFGWFQQFDQALADKAVNIFSPARSTATYFGYTKGGWNIVNKETAAQAEYFPVFETKYFDPKSVKDFDADVAAGARAVFCAELVK